MRKIFKNQVVTFIQPENKREINLLLESIYLLWNTNVPAVLVECGFLSNPSEAQLLKDIYQDKWHFLFLWNFKIYRVNSQRTKP